MRGELPQFKRCCICLPLRRGLIMWGYIRLVIGVLLLVSLTNALYHMLRVSKTESGYTIYVALLVFFVILAGVDIVLNVVFVMAEHTKDLKLLKAYYIYSFFLWIVMIVMSIAVVVQGIYVMQWQEMGSLSIWVLLCDLMTLIAEIIIQAYVLLLLRSEFIKQTTNCEFRFVNNAAESACKIKCEEDNKTEEDYKTTEYNKANGDIANEKKERIF